MSHRHPTPVGVGPSGPGGVRPGTDPPARTAPARPTDETVRSPPRQRVDGRLDPRVREHVEEHGSPAHGYDHAPERSEPGDFGHGESTGVQQL